MSNKIDDENKKAVLEMARVISEATAPMKAFTESINKIAEEQTRFVESFTKPLLEATNFARTIQNSMIDINKFLLKATESFKEIQEFHKRFVQARKEEKEALIKTGWMICPSLMKIPAVYLRKAVIKYHNGDNGKAIAKLMKDYYGEEDWSRLEAAVDSWENHKLFTKQRMKIIRDALWAHRQKKYTLSIPTLLPIFEGITTDYCKIKGIKVADSATTKKAKKALKELELQGDNYTSEILLTFITRQLYIHTDQLKKSNNRKQLNRHGILHGSYSGYADGTRSLKCFLILDVLSLLTL